MIEIIFTILFLVLIASSIYRENERNKYYEKLLEKIFKQAEIDKYNLVTALKSYTAEDYSNGAVYPDTKPEEEQQEEETPFQDLDELALEDPEKFDKVIGL